jgi:hypothetical protein
VYHAIIVSYLLTVVSLFATICTSKRQALEKQPLRNPEVVRIKMHSITLSKVPGVPYTAHSFKTYEAHRNGECVGYLAQDCGSRWEVVDRNFNLISKHTTIKAAVRVARKVLV